MTLAWVIGAGGLLGRALVGALSRPDVHLHSLPGPLAWRQPQVLMGQLAQAAADFVALAARSPGRRACIFWAAGIGTMDGSADDLAPESAALACVLDAMQRHATGLAPGALRICLASSAGALFAGVRDGRLIADDHPVAPTTAYAEAKLAQEMLLLELARQVPQVAALVCRVSTLYGTRGPQAGRDKGLIAHLATGCLQRRPVHVYVPLDTMRDYLAADDAAARMVAAALMPGALPQGGAPCLVASGVSTSVSDVVHLFHRIGGRKPLVVTGANWRGDLYLPCLRFQPSAWLEQRCGLPARTMAEGIAGVLRERMGGH